MRNWIIAVAVLAVAGCQSTPPGPEQPGAAVEERGATQKPPAATTQQVQTPGVAPVTPSPGERQTLPSILKDPNSILSKRSVFFDYDSFAIKDEYRPLIEAHGKYLVANRGAKMLIQGNTDERGSREYNLALGQKRAEAVKRMLVLLGAGEDQIESVSLGEEKPRNAGHDEAAWTENRRSDMLYSGEF